MKSLNAMLCSLILASAAIAQPPGFDSQSAAVDELFAATTAGKKPGAAVLVIRQGQVLHKKGYGLADVDSGTPIGSDTNFRLASVSKEFTAMAIMILAEQKKLSYDDRLTKFFPEFPAYADKITVRNLLQHTSALPDHEGLFEASKKVSTDWPRSAKTPRDPFEPTAHDALELLAKQHSLRFTPGAKFEYSNAGYAVLACVIEKAAGKPYARFLKEAIFEPLGMRATVVADGRPGEVARAATTYTMKNGACRDIDYTPFNRIYGDEGVFSSLDDLAKWLPALEGPKLISRETLALATTPGKLNNGQATHYGFGLTLLKQSGMDTIGHGGAWVGVRTYMVDYGPGRLAVVILANRDDFYVSVLAAKVAKIYLKD